MKALLEIRIHGRGGQGAQTVGHVIAQAFFNAGKYVQTFATYGGERRGAPVTSFVRVNEELLRLRCDIEHPDAVMVFEPTFLEGGSGLAGLRPGAVLVINTARAPAAFAHLGDYRVVAVPLFMPIVASLGFDPIWWGILMMINLQIGMTSPPFGLLLFVMKGVAPRHITMKQLYMAALPFIGCDVVSMTLIVIFPSIATWLPYAIRP